MRKGCSLLLTAIGLVFAAAPATAFELDSHYHLRFGFSLATCFDWHESHLIASADWGMDENATTVAEMNPIQRRNKIDWHAFGHSDQRFHELWQRSRDEQDLELRLIKLGQLMHFVEDWESHAGYGVRMGHARDTFGGRDPDSLGGSEARNQRMVQSALTLLLLTCEDLGRLDADPDEELVRIIRWLYADGLLDDLFEASDPAWKKGKMGGFRKRHVEIKTINRKRIETMIATHLAGLPGKNVPQDFTPGDPERGLPRSLGLRFERDGDVTQQLPASAVQAVEISARLPPAPDVTASVERIRLLERAWRVRVELTNEGESAAADVIAEVVVIDADDERVLGESNRPVKELAVGGSTAFWITVPTGTKPDRDVIVGVYARAQGDDDGMDNVDWWMTDEVANGAPEQAPIVDVDEDRVPDAEESIEVVEGPRTVVTDDALCIVATALASEGDSPQKLSEAQVRLVAVVDGEEMSIPSDISTLWSATPTDRGLVAGKALACFEPAAEECAAWRALQPNDPVRYEWKMRIRGGPMKTRSAALDRTGREGMDGLCR